uniref:Uncharacterized protein n=1 Tax=Mola mola TaxID=94237 RepID=A0A3Q4AAA5_MOLML
TSSQINLELYASYVYLSMTYYFDGTTSHCTTLPSFSLIIQTRRTSMQRSSLQNQRGGRIFLQDHKLYWVTKPFALHLLSKGFQSSGRSSSDGVKWLLVTTCDFKTSATTWPLSGDPADAFGRPL